MPEKLHRCVEKVMAKGHSEDSAWAICRSSMNMAEDPSDGDIDAAISAWNEKQAALAEAKITHANILRRIPDGGGVVEVPITVETPVIDLSRTASGSTGKIGLTTEALQEMERNFGIYDAPVSAGFGHHNRDPAEAQDAFIEAVSLRQGALWARIWLSKDKFPEFDAGKWRGFSIEATKDKIRPASAYDGWTLTGGIFTNNPALPVNFKIAASANDGAMVPMSIDVILADARDKPSLPAGKGKEHTTMSENETVTLAAHEAKVNEARRALVLKSEEAESFKMQLEAKVVEVSKLSEENSTLQSTVSTTKAELAAHKALATTHDAQVATLRKAQEALQAKVVELSEKLAETEAEAIGTKVKTIIAEAVTAGVPPAIFEGYEGAPADWVKAKFATFEAFQEFVSALRGVSKGKKPEAVKSGSEPAKNDSADGTVQLTAEERELFQRLNIGSGEFVGVTTEAEARKRFEAMRAAKKENN